MQELLRPQAKSATPKSSSLLPFFPNADPNNKKQKRSCRVLRSRRSTMLLIQTLVALMTCLCKIAFTVWAFTMYRPQQGVGTLPSKNHVSAAQINTGAHVILDVFSSLFLGAGNYCMQVSVAPSAESIRALHIDGQLWISVCKASRICASRPRPRECSG